MDTESTLIEHYRNETNLAKFTRPSEILESLSLFVLSLSPLNKFVFLGPSKMAPPPFASDYGNTAGDAFFMLLPIALPPAARTSNPLLLHNSSSTCKLGILKTTIGVQFPSKAIRPQDACHPDSPLSPTPSGVEGDPTMVRQSGIVTSGQSFANLHKGNWGAAQCTGEMRKRNHRHSGFVTNFST